MISGIKYTLPIDSVNILIKKTAQSSFPGVKGGKITSIHSTQPYTDRAKWISSWLEEMPNHGTYWLNKWIFSPLPFSPYPSEIQNRLVKWNITQKQTKI